MKWIKITNEDELPPVLQRVLLFVNTEVAYPVILTDDERVGIGWLKIEAGERKFVVLGLGAIPLNQVSHYCYITNIPKQ